MTSLDIARRRLHNQHIAGSTFEEPDEVVAWLGAVQAQDYLGSLWAVGLRMRQAVEADIERAAANKTIIRTWPMRGTLHFVAAADVRWMLELLTPRVVAGMARRLHRHFGLDEATFARSKELFAAALQGGKQLSRDAMYEVLAAAQISPAGGRGLHILSRLAQDGLICFGARRGKQHTFALLAEWAPTAKTLERDEALAELTRRYFTSHGPATLHDFTWWSGLTMADARAGLEMVKSQFRPEVIGGRTYWFDPSRPAARGATPAACLLPAYDEYTVAYKDRSAVRDPSQAKQPSSGDGLLSPTIVVNGRVVGTWQRTLKRDSVVITPSFFAGLKPAETRAFAAAAKRYGEFLGASVSLP
jgi:hypothetical protein